MKSSVGQCIGSSVVVALVIVLAACASPEGGGAADAGADRPDAATDSDGDARLRDLANGEACAVSAQCRGACCELHLGNMTVCAQIAPFDTSQHCACAEDSECAAIKLCGNPDFCQESNVVSAQRFCSTVCR